MHSVADTVYGGNPSIAEDTMILKKYPYRTQKRASGKEKARAWELFLEDRRVAKEKAFPTLERSADAPLECIYHIEERIDVCAVCASELVVMDSGFPTCSNPLCGIIYKITLDYSPEWRFYGENDKGGSNQTRCGTPINPLLIESSFGCKVLTTGKSSYEMHKIRKWTEWQSVPHREKLLYEEFQFISAMATNAGIPKIFVDRAMTIHKNISEQKMFRGANRDSIKAASIYLSCRMNGCPRTAQDIADIFKLDKSNATKGCSTAINILENIERDLDPYQKSVLVAITPSDFIERFCSKFNIPEKLVMLAMFIADKVNTQNIICDNIPQAVAAGIIYFISAVFDLKISKKSLYAVCGVSEVTINKCFQKLSVCKDQLIPPMLVAEYMAR
jgi:transcription initiation factor TFIIB